MKIRLPLLLAVALAALPLHAQTPTAAVTPYAPKAAESASMRDTYKGIFHIGAAINSFQVNGSRPEYTALLLKDFDCISPENEMKMGPMHPRPGNDDSSYNFPPADAYVDFGVKNNLFVIGHNLCWHSQLPAWMSQPDAGQATLTKEVMMQRLHDHIIKVVTRYKGRVKGWDVVNEGINDGGGYRNTVFYQYIGKEYFLLAFKWAHEADPDAELYYNDYNLDASDAKRATCLELVKYLKDNGAHITGVGMQGHYNLNTPTAAKIDETIGMFAALGVKVMITELDVTVNTGAVSGAVGSNPGGAPAAGGRGAGRGGAPAVAVQPFVLPPSLPSIDQLKTKLTLTDAQAAAIAPLVEAIERARTGIVTEQTKLADLRTAANTKISNLLTDAQKPQFTQLINPAPAGGGRGGRGGAAAPALSDAQLQAQAKRYGEIFAVFLKHRDSITRVTFWGLRDPDSWRASNNPLLYDASYGRKPAYDAVINAVKAAGITVAK